MGVHAIRWELPTGGSFYILVLSSYEGDFARFHMQTPEVDALASQVPQDEQLDLILPSLFLSAATVILAVQDPIYYHFEARPFETLAIVGLLIVVLLVAVLRRNMPLLFAASGALLLVSAFAVVTQPTQLATPVVLIWPV